MKKILSLALVIGMLLSMTIMVSANEYIVQPGDVLWKIARENETTVKGIVEANNIVDANMIYPGQVLKMSEVDDVEMPVIERTRPMRILVINDDGYDAIGLVTLHEELAAKGYDVWTVAPIENQSGGGTSIKSYKKEHQLIDNGDQKYAFDGTPTDCFKVAVNIVMPEKPDLVISGVNDGPNFAELQMSSGTVGGAARAVRHGYPAIAASLVYPGGEGLEEYMAVTVDYVVSLVDELNIDWAAGEMLMPLGSGLSINYPAMPLDEILGVIFVPNEDVYTDFLNFKYDEDKGGIYKHIHRDIMKGMTNDPAIVNDYTLGKEGYVTISVIDGNWNASQDKVDFMEEKLKDIPAYK